MNALGERAEEEGLSCLSQFAGKERDLEREERKRKQDGESQRVCVCVCYQDSLRHNPIGTRKTERERER